MKRILLDENIPYGVRRHLDDCEVRHVRDTGWAGLSNGDLIAAAEAAGFDVMITADKNLRYQQNLAGRRLALVVIESNAWPIVRRNVEVTRPDLRRLRDHAKGFCRETVIRAALFGPVARGEARPDSDSTFSLNATRRS